MRSAFKMFAAVAVAGVVSVTSAALATGAVDGARTVRPAEGLVFDVGSKHTVSYFLADGGICNLTLVVGEKTGEEGATASVGARIKMAIAGGKSAQIETAEGKSLEFSCAYDAKTLSARPLDIVAYSTIRK